MPNFAIQRVDDQNSTDPDISSIRSLAARERDDAMLEELIVVHQKRRYRSFGGPNFIDNLLKPLWQLAFRRPSQR
jgi:hypothetical protein